MPTAYIASINSTYDFYVRLLYFALGCYKIRLELLGCATKRQHHNELVLFHAELIVIYENVAM
jgi:hypothetical protein